MRIHNLVFGKNLLPIKKEKKKSAMMILLVMIEVERR